MLSASSWWTIYSWLNQKFLLQKVELFLLSMLVNISRMVLEYSFISGLLPHKSYCLSGKWMKVLSFTWIFFIKFLPLQIQCARQNSPPKDGKRSLWLPACLICLLLGLYMYNMSKKTFHGKVTWNRWRMDRWKGSLFLFLCEESHNLVLETWKILWRRSKYSHCLRTWLDW